MQRDIVNHFADFRRAPPSIRRLPGFWHRVEHFLQSWIRLVPRMELHQPRRAPQNPLCYSCRGALQRVRAALAADFAQSTVTKLRISVVQYLNTVPLVRGFTHGALQGKYDLFFSVPSQCAEALRTGAADVAIIPAIEYQRIVSQGIALTVLPDLAIASKERVRSLLHISKFPIRQARRIALDRSSRSTQALVKILCAQ